MCTWWGLLCIQQRRSMLLKSMFIHQSSGGAVLASRDGKIVYENTLDARLDVAFRKKLPEICKWLFGRIVMLLFYRQLWLSTVELEVEVICSCISHILHPGSFVY